eukprot:scaffold6728_cov90-Isochrysis_galbana.AAC.2
MEYVPGGDLLEVLNSQPRFTEGQVGAAAGLWATGGVRRWAAGAADRYGRMGGKGLGRATQSTCVSAAAG